MAKKMKFDWEFVVSDDEKYLEVNLNDGNNRLIEIRHENFYRNLTDILIDISIHQYIHGTKTDIQYTSFEALTKAQKIHDKSKADGTMWRNVQTINMDDIDYGL